MRPGCHPWARRCSACSLTTGTSRPQVQQARVGRRRPMLVEPVRRGHLAASAFGELGSVQCHRESSRGSTVSGTQSRRVTTLASRWLVWTSRRSRSRSQSVRRGYGPTTQRKARIGDAPTTTAVVSSQITHSMYPSRPATAKVVRVNCSERHEEEQADVLHSMTWSARASTAGGIVRPSALAVL